METAGNTVSEIVPSAEQARSVITVVVGYVNYGSEFDEPEPCISCESAQRDPFEQSEGGC